MEIINSNQTFIGLSWHIIIYYKCAEIFLDKQQSRVYTIPVSIVTKRSMR